MNDDVKKSATGDTAFDLTRVIPLAPVVIVHPRCMTVTGSLKKQGSGIFVIELTVQIEAFFRK